MLRQSTTDDSSIAVALFAEEAREAAQALCDLPPSSIRFIESCLNDNSQENGARSTSTHRKITLLLEAVGQMAGWLLRREGPGYNTADVTANSSNEEHAQLPGHATARQLLPSRSVGSFNLVTALAQGRRQPYSRELLRSYSHFVLLELKLDASDLTELLSGCRTPMARDAATEGIQALREWGACLGRYLAMQEVASTRHQKQQHPSPSSSYLPLPPPPPYPSVLNAAESGGGGVTPPHVVASDDDDDEEEEEESLLPLRRRKRKAARPPTRHHGSPESTTPVGDEHAQEADDDDEHSMIVDDLRAALSQSQDHVLKLRQEVRRLELELGASVEKHTTGTTATTASTVQQMECMISMQDSIRDDQNDCLARIEAESRELDSKMAAAVRLSETLREELSKKTEDLSDAASLLESQSEKMRTIREEATVMNLRESIQRVRLQDELRDTISELEQLKSSTGNGNPSCDSEAANLLKQVGIFKQENEKLKKENADLKESLTASQSECESIQQESSHLKEAVVNAHNERMKVESSLSVEGGASRSSQEEEKRRMRLAIEHRDALILKLCNPIVRSRYGL